MVSLIYLFIAFEVGSDAFLPAFEHLVAEEGAVPDLIRAAVYELQHAGACKAFRELFLLLIGKAFYHIDKGRGQIHVARHGRDLLPALKVRMDNDQRHVDIVFI